RHRCHHVLTVNDIDPLAGDQLSKIVREIGKEFLVLEVIPDVWNRGRGGTELANRKLVDKLFVRPAPAGARLHDENEMTRASEASRQLVCAPSASPAYWRKRIGCEQNPHSTRI